MHEPTSAPIDHAPLNAMPFGDVVFSQRSVRRFRGEPISIDDLHLLMEAAVRAPNGGNNQPARFVLVLDRARLARLSELYRTAWWTKRRVAGTGWESIDDIPAEDRVARSAARLADTIGIVPAMVLAFGRADAPGQDAWSVVPAVQNLMLAARALGIGSLPTTLHPEVMGEVRELLGVPDDMYLHLLIPLGYPESASSFGVSRRKPTAETVWLDHWNAPVPWA